LIHFYKRCPEFSSLTSEAATLNIMM